MDFNRVVVIFVFYDYVYFAGTTILNDEFISNPTCKKHKIHSFENYQLFKTRSALECAKKCALDIECFSLNFLKTTFECSLNRGFIAENCSNAVYEKYVVYYEKKGKAQDCLHGGNRSSSPLYCDCIDGYIGDRCERLMQNCAEGCKRPYYHLQKKYFYILPPGTSQPIRIVCRMNWGGRDMLMQHYDSLYDFNRSWRELSEGFWSDPNHEEADGWIGLEHIHIMTRYTPRQICYEFKAMFEQYTSTCIEGFSIGNESNGYRIANLGPVQSPACLEHPVGAAFSTFDKDNDNNSTRSCAADYQAPFWYNENCARCNLLGSLNHPPGGNWSGDISDAFWEGLAFSPLSIKIWFQ
ncbi:ficolin-1 [Patella vulgata]|uniref:ficolin-1 n=1 Tax=Patella vulgata TaxID=6465 RepID=UPI0024A8CE91|nr:ficolin-1 [Patella vulgata]